MTRVVKEIRIRLNALGTFDCGTHRRYETENPDMTEQRQYDGGADTAHSSPVQQSGRSETPADASPSAGHTGHTGPEAVAGPFTLRETVIGVSVLVMFVGTILPFVDGVNLWRTFSLFFLGIGILLPVAALALLVARRQGSKRLRVGSLSVDQFASVAAAFAAAFFFLQTVTTFEIGALIALLGSVGFLVATVGGPHIGVFKPDFAGRPSSSAHPIAREALPAKQRPPKPVPAEKVSGWSSPSSSGESTASGPSSAGYSAGYAVAGFAAGQGAGASPDLSVQNRSAREFSAQDSGHQPASSSARAEASATAPAEAQATAAQPSADHASGVQADSSADASAKSAAPAASKEHAGSEAPAESAAPAASASSETRASETQAAPADPQTHTGSQTHTDPAAPAESAGPAATAAQPRVEETAPDRTAAHPVVQRHKDTADEHSSHPRTESISATRDADDDEPMLEAFWFAVGTPRSVVDEQTGAPLFVLQPGDWEVGIEDRGHEFLVQDKRTGRTGVMRDLRNIERAPTES
ncbi:hypothetical protein GCM10027404_15960 [Arthrobacter tumbae]|uniref:hypothetical protein n=1 Tax=Arthrobacter tumbae TaxID=163874 RepID=UPI001EF942C2|nr:hypothetical protein [Arthrobacter tumbae]MBM7780646.1 hypothetical protein [Arthrobacter tumbae]